MLFIGTLIRLICYDKKILTNHKNHNNQCTIIFYTLRLIPAFYVEGFFQS